MEGAIVVIALVVALVAFDTLGRLERRRPEPRGESESTERIVVDLTDREP